MYIIVRWLPDLVCRTWTQSIIYNEKWKSYRSSTLASLEPDWIKYTTTNIHDVRKINNSLTFLRILPALDEVRARPFIHSALASCTTHHHQSKSGQSVQHGLRAANKYTKTSLIATTVTGRARSHRTLLLSGLRFFFSAHYTNVKQLPQTTTKWMKNRFKKIRMNQWTKRVMFFLPVTRREEY